MKRLPATILALLLLLLLAGCEEQPPATSGEPGTAPGREATTADGEPAPDSEAIARNNRGVGLMGSFDYPAALTVFEQLADDYPDVTAFRFNTAVSTLNRQLEGDEQKALAMLENIIGKEPGNLNAHYMTGLLKLRKGDKSAVAHLQTVLDKDPQDAYAAYFLGQALEQQGENDEALVLYERTMQTDPYLRSAYYAAFLINRRAGERDRAKELLAIYERLASNPRAQLAEYKYTRMGRKAEVLVVDNGAPEPQQPGEELFGEPRLIATGLPGDNASITVADINGDGRMDLFVADSSSAEGRFNSILIADGDGGYTPDEAHPLAGVDRVRAALWGDIDNDGLLDVYLCRDGGNRLWRQVSRGRWEDVTQSSRSAGEERDTIDGALFDADHDGDLDIYTVNADGPNELFSNNLDGTFRTLARERRIDGSPRGSRAVLTVDLDNDRDTDIVVINNQPPHAVHINDRLWSYSDGEGFERFANAPILDAVAADTDADGHPEIYAINSQGTLTRWLNDGQGGDWFEQPVLDLEQVERLALLDLTGDGILNLLAASSRAWQLTTPEGSGWRRLLQRGTPLGVFTTLVDAGDAGPSLVTLHDGRLEQHPPGSGRLPFVTLSLSGRHYEADAMRSNASGIGTRIALRQGSRWTLTDSFRHDTGPGQSLQPIAIGLGGGDVADFVALTWSDGVFQTELALEAGRLHAISETQRQLSSCPVLFAWNGTRHAFVSDILGVGGMGYMVAPGEYATPRPHENFLLPEGALQPLDGRYVLKIGEPMEEAAYIDAVRLVAYDLPPGWQPVLDERMAILGPQPSGETLFYGDERLPVKATDIDGRDVLALILHADLEAPPVGGLDRRFIGRLQQEQQLTLEFDGPLDDTDGTPVLMIDGWVEYPYSQTMFAAWQAGATLAAPTLEVRNADGQWQTLLEQFGYPAGMPRRMALPLEKLPRGVTALRLRTNQEIYWDRVAIVHAQENDAVVRHGLPLAAAQVAETGFALRTTGDQRQPHYDYARRAPLWDTRHMSGYYTAFGESTELVAEIDDAVAIIGPGEEVHLEFDATLPPLPPGWTRRFVVESNGWAKDMDLFTRDGETVGPLPTTGKPVVRREALHARYNTRFRSGY